MLEREQHNSDDQAPREMRLCQVNKRAVHRVRSVYLDREEADRLEKLGIMPGAYIEPVFNDFRGTLAVLAGERYVILGRRETYKLVVVQHPRPSDAFEG